MKIKTTIAAAAVVAMSQTAAFAGNISNVGTDDNEIVFVPTTPVGTPSSSMGSLGGSGGVVVPALVGLVVVGALVANGGS